MRARSWCVQGGVAFAYTAGAGLVDDRVVEEGHENAPEQQTEGATRLLVLWVCWVVLALFLIAAGVVGFS